MPGREAKYSATNFETVIKKLVKKHTGDENTLLASADEVCKVFVCAQPALNPDTSHPFIMRSFEGYPPLGDLTIWQAARATSAAPTFFKQLVIGNHQFIDGGLGSNNPCRVLLKECQQIYRKKPGCTVSCIISIGSGMPKNIGISELNGIGFSWLRDVVKTLSGMATDCEAINEEVATWFKATPNLYYRFNVEQGLQDVEMDKHEKLNIVTAKTEGYLSKDVQQERLVQAAKALSVADQGPCLVTELGK
ncbi:unnamed protein product [Aureobasidium pullulans]|nr:unnamed protein product [Aureobasidium pullulans]